MTGASQSSGCCCTRSVPASRRQPRRCWRVGEPYLHSLAKGFLSPDTARFAIGPASILATLEGARDERRRASRGRARTGPGGGLPEQLARGALARRSSVGEVAGIPGPGDRLLLSSCRSRSICLAQGRLAVPGSVFGAPRTTGALSPVSSPAASRAPATAMTDGTDTIVLFRPVGEKELALIRQLGPSRLSRTHRTTNLLPGRQQGCPSRLRATRNARDGEHSYVTRFRVQRDFLQRYRARWSAGSCTRSTDPAEDLPAFNTAIVGLIEVIAAFGSS